MCACHVLGEALGQEKLEAGVGEHAQRRRVRVQAAAGEALARQEHRCSRSTPWPLRDIRCRIDWVWRPSSRWFCMCEQVRVQGRYGQSDLAEPHCIVPGKPCRSTEAGGGAARRPAPAATRPAWGPRQWGCAHKRAAARSTPPAPRANPQACPAPRHVCMTRQTGAYGPDSLRLATHHDGDAISRARVRGNTAIAAQAHVEVQPACAGQVVPVRPDLQSRSREQLEVVGPARGCI